ncbi:MAG: OmpA family protein [Pseudomonadota bacterium]
MKLKQFGTTGLIASVAALAACATAPEEPEIQVVEEVAPVIEEPQVDPIEMAMMELETEVGNRVFFGYDRSNLVPDAQATLRRQADFLQRPENMDLRIMVAGNCDERGTREYNLALGQRRADKVKEFLVGMGVDASRIKTVSYGKERPLDPRSTPDAWSKNRNGTTTIEIMDTMDTMF